MNMVYQIIMIALAIIIIIGVFKGFGKDRKIIVYSDYDDLGLTFLVPASFVLIVYIFTLFGLNQIIAMIIGVIVSVFIALKVVINTYEDNNQDLGKSLLALITKLPLAIIWILNIVSVLDPGGQTATQRRKNRATALVILTFLTPIVTGLVVNKSGSYINPMSWFRGRRIGSVRNHL